MKAVILAGGTGTRLWPMSRDLKPKQFHAFAGNRTMLQHTYERLNFLKPEDIFVSTNIQYESLVKKQLPSVAARQLIIEPAMRDTGPCICYAAHRLKELGLKNEVMAIVYADHLIQKSESLQKSLQFTAKHVAATGKFAVIAVRAKYANPNLGYIKIGRPIKESDGFEIYELERFVEKPDTETAKHFLNSYKYLWNTGLYVWKVETILQRFKKLSPKVFEAATGKVPYSESPKISIDYAVIEKIEPKSMHVIPADLGWNDIGNWAALHEELASHEKENIASGELLTLETEGSVVLGNSGKLLVTYGVKDMVVIDTPEALLVMPKSKAAEVKKLIEELKKRNKHKVL